MRGYIKQLARNLSQLRLQTMNDWRSLHYFHLFNILQVSIGKQYLEDYTIFGTIRLFGYGYQLIRKGRA